MNRKTFMKFWMGRLASLLAVFTFASMMAMAQTKTVSGVVVDQYGDPVLGASVVVKGTSNGVASDADGKFTITNVNPADVLSVSFVGYTTVVETVGDKQTFKFVLMEDGQSLNDVVVVGYGTVKKTDLTGSVGSVEAAKIQGAGNTSVMQSLQGQIAGVNISQSSSRAGDGMSIQIRGKSTLGDSSSPLYVIDGVISDNMDFLNPADIEKVDILKDASSTAIYGSRATNGVVMITTKKGAAPGVRTTVSYDGYYGWKTVANMPEFMDGEEFMKYRFSRYLTSKQNAADGSTKWEMTQANYRNVWGAGSQVIQNMYKNNDYTDWANDIVTNNGQQQNHFVNIAGNSRDISYRVGLGYQNEEGVVQDTYERWNIKAALDAKINAHWATGVSANLATANQSVGSQHAIDNGFLMAPIMMAYYKEDGNGHRAGEPIYQPGKDAVMYPDGGGPTSTINPVVDMANSKDQTRTYNAIANLYLQYSPIDEVIIKTTFAPSYQKARHGVFYGAQTQIRGGNGNQAEETNTEHFSYTWDTQANYINTFGKNDEHSLNVLGLFSAYQDKMESQYAKITNMPFDVDWNNWGSGTPESMTSAYSRISMLSWVARVNYSFMDKYLLTVSSRWDGSSKFGKDRRWGMFPSAAVAWRITEEPWMQSTRNWLSNLKLRLSYGVTGNNLGVGAYQTQSTANTKYYYNFGSTIANGYGYELSNMDLTWEKTYETNLGLDFGFLNSRINGTIDIYQRDSKKLLMEMQTPMEMGSTTGSIVSNVGKVRNRGIELMVNTVNVLTKDWRWETSFSYSRNLNTIRELNGEKEDLVGNKWFIGHDINVVYGYKILGICTAEQAKEFCADPNKPNFFEGEVIYEDVDGNGAINAKDRQILGHGSPTWTGSFNSNLQYKNWDFSFSLYASVGGRVYSPFMREFTRYGSRGTQHLKIDYYIPQGAPVLSDPSDFVVGAVGADYASKGITAAPETHYGSWPFPTSTNGNGGGVAFNTDNAENSYYFVNNSYLRMKNITLGYTFPTQLLQKAGIQNLRVYATVLNPFTVTNYKGFDPEWADAAVNNGKGGVSSRTYQIGVNFKF